MGGHGLPLHGFPQSGLLLGETSSKRSLDLAKTWVTQCEQRHDCGTRRDVRKLPHRLIDLMPMERSSSRAPRHGKAYLRGCWAGLNERLRKLRSSPSYVTEGVKIVTSFPLDAKFASLSHTWGETTKPFKLTRETQTQYHDFIDLASLPKSFQDAISMTRHLGLRYLWIDCFCIEQDSAIDFDIEASKMADIFRDSFIVIVAAASKNSHGGCFHKSRSDIFLRIAIGHQQDLFFGVRQCKFTTKIENWGQVFEEFPTHQRAWCYQEQILAQRVLYCNRQELAFECKKMHACECGNPKMAPHITLSHGGSSTKKLLTVRGKELITALSSAPAEPYSIANINARWEAAVACYSRLGLGRPEQRLSALSGLAKAFQAISGHEESGNPYLSGLWRRSIRANLLWRVSTPGQKGNKRPRTFRAPSWSWASVDTPSGVEFDRQQSHQSSWLDMSDWKGFLVDADSIPAATDTTGAVQSGFLRFKTHLRRAHIRTVCLYCKRALNTNKSKRVLLETDREQHRCTFWEKSIETLGGDFKFFNDCTLKRDPGLRWKQTPSPGKHDRRCMLAEIFLLHIAEKETQKNHIDHFLALKRAERRWWRVAYDFLFQCIAGRNRTPQFPQYERIGLVVMAHRKSGQRERWFNTVWKAGWTSEAKVLIDLV